MHLLAAESGRFGNGICLIFGKTRVPPWYAFQNFSKKFRSDLFPPKAPGGLLFRDALPPFLTLQSVTVSLTVFLLWGNNGYV
jgi:hypothetical protein